MREHLSYPSLWHKLPLQLRPLRLHHQPANGSKPNIAQAHTGIGLGRSKGDISPSGTNAAQKNGCARQPLCPCMYCNFACRKASSFVWPFRRF
jgi:hypothetical protein